MVASTLTGKQITPALAVEWCGNNYYIGGVGTDWAYFEAAVAHFNRELNTNMTIQDIGKDINQAVSALKSGKLVISSQGQGIFTSGGHFIVLAGMDGDKIIVRDPNKRNAVDKNYDTIRFTASDIDAAANNYWVFDI